MEGCGDSGYERGRGGPIYLRLPGSNDFDLKNQYFSYF